MAKAKFGKLEEILTEFEIYFGFQIILIPSSPGHPFPLQPEATLLETPLLQHTSRRDEGFQRFASPRWSRLRWRGDAFDGRLHGEGVCDF